MPRALWKGAITFGLVHIPVALYPAARSQTVSFDWLERKSLKPVGYKRVVKETGKEVAKEDIVRGLEYEPDHYVVLTDEEIKGANAKATQTVDIMAFVKGEDIAPYYYDTPYVLAPIGRGEKVYMLLRDALVKSGRVGIAEVVIQTRQHLAALIPFGTALVLNTLRWANEIRSFEDIELPPATTKKNAFSAKEFSMAEQLIDEMAEDWKPERFHDTFHDDIMAIVEQKVKQGKIERVVPPEKLAEEGGGADIIDLTELLKRSLRGGGGTREAANDERGESGTPAHAARGRESERGAREEEAPHTRRAAAAAPARSSRTLKKVSRPKKKGATAGAGTEAKSDAKAGTRAGTKSGAKTSGSRTRKAA